MIKLIVRQQERTVFQKHKKIGYDSTACSGQSPIKLFNQKKGNNTRIEF